ncbi:MAG: biotin/lipoate A/B protein ligase family protein [Longimicrobiales bacterium]
MHGSGGGLDPVDGPTNMAIDAALLESVKGGARPTIRLYRWRPACLSFGRNQPARGRYAVQAAADRGIDFVRRPTGGQAVLHHHELTYAVIAPVAAIGKPRAAYGVINRALVDGLGRLGVRAALAEGGGLRGGDRTGGRVGAAGVAAEDASPTAGRPPAARPSAGQASSGPDWDAACFRRPARGEVVVGGAKLVGSAQRMEARTILQHGSILVGGSQTPAEDLLVPSPTTTPTTKSRRDTGWTTLERELGARPGLDELAAAVCAGFEAVLGVALSPSGLSVAERESLAGLRAHYDSDEWTWRR